MMIWDILICIYWLIDSLIDKAVDSLDFTKSENLILFSNPLSLIMDSMVKLELSGLSNSAIRCLYLYSFISNSQEQA